MKISRFIFPAGDQPARVYHARRLLLVGVLSMSVGMVAVTPWRQPPSTEAAQVRTPVLTLPGPPMREVGSEVDLTSDEPLEDADAEAGADGAEGEGEDAGEPGGTGESGAEGGDGPALPDPAASATPPPARSSSTGKPASGATAEKPGGTTAKPCPTPSQPSQPSQPSKPQPSPTPPPSTPPPAGTGTLKAGDSGPRVSRLQEFLFLQGFTFVRVTGLYDDATVRGVAKLQSDRGITGDPSGVFGPHTAARVGQF
ncbi:peptidoglycan-binding protein [Streptomyces sp. IBSNAI002]|uniref:peptidoglycan-binding protein n=1 Tax=Streptomyces sp. IBSNAI002 TaxID=3457500 RepID=UPI003FCF7B1C